MQVFKAALKTFFRHPIYLVVYVVWMSCMGLFMGMSDTDVQGEEYIQRPNVAVIDRDGGELAQSLKAFVFDNSVAVELEDTERALQDAVMQERARYIVIIPEGFSADFAKAAADGKATPSLQTVVGAQSTEATMMDNLVDEYLNVARTYTLALPDAGQDQVVARTDSAMERSADVSVMQITEVPSVSSSFLLYLQFASYTILLSIAVCSAVVMSRFGREETRRRIGSSPISPISFNLQLAAACFVIMLICWAFVTGLGLVVFGGKLAGAGVDVIASGVASLFCYSLFGLAFGFLIGQITSNELVMNAASNVTGLAISFLGGVWISLDLVGEPIMTIAKFTPTYYYNEALRAGFDAAGGGFTPEMFANLGVVCLFALAVFAVSMAISRLKVGRMGAWNGSSTKASLQPAA
jgi:ABC-2 type transport system permease protein